MLILISESLIVCVVLEPGGLFSGNRVNGEEPVLLWRLRESRESF